MTIREQWEELEEQTLSSMATLAKNTRGRERPARPDPIRTCFQRDRDRIIHCNSFRRLKHKTQVFLSPEGDHYRTRLTHTLEVSQIGRTITRALRLNEDLFEAAALGHDLGHTPFGHAGERALNEVCPYGFVHAQHSVRVVEELEHGGEGLNLTWEVRNAIACHSNGVEAETMEGRILRYADKIAYINHDIEDAIRAGVLREDDIPWDLQYSLGRSKSQRITSFITDILENSREDIRMSPEMQKDFTKLHDFMFEAVYTNPTAKAEEGKAEDLVKYLYEYYRKNPEKLPEDYQTTAETDPLQAACDFVAGMTDRYAVNLYQEIFIPKFWGI